MRLQDMPESKAELPERSSQQKLLPRHRYAETIRDHSHGYWSQRWFLQCATVNTKHCTKPLPKKQQMHPQRESRDHHRPWCRHTLGPAACPQELCHIFRIFGNLMTAYTSTCAKFGTVSLKHTAPAKILENVACGCGSCSRIAGAA
jgi:hypothetical protein